jgi:hypothetical protein
MGNVNMITYPEFNKVIDIENDLYFGIVDAPSNSSPYSNQALQIGCGYSKNFYILENFTENTNSLVYEFNRDLSLTFTKRHNNTIVIMLKSNKYIHINKVMDNYLIETFTPFNEEANAFEFNKLYNFIYNDKKIK